MKTLIAMLLVLVGVSAEGRLGETNVEVAKRYGAVTRRENLSTNEWRGTYNFRGFVVEVSFSNNVSMAETVLAKRKLTAEEKEALISTIGGDGKWSKIPLLDQWINAETKALARCDRVALGQDAIMVSTREYAEVESARQEAQKREQAKGAARGF
jgi:hypothetical protein